MAANAEGEMAISRSPGSHTQQHKQTLKHLAYQYLPLEPPEKPDRRKGLGLDRLDRSVYLQAHMPIFEGPDQDKPWVEELYRYVHGH